MNKLKKSIKKSVILTVWATLFSSFTFGQVNKIIPAEIEYWVGSGANEAILIVNWCDHNTGLAWGYRFDGTTTAAAMLAAIDAADDRLTVVGSSYYVEDIIYQDALSGSMDFTSVNYDYPMYNVNDVMASGISSQSIVNGDIMEWGGLNCSEGSGWSNLVWTFSVKSVSNPNVEYYTIHAVSGFYGTVSPAGDSTVTAGSNVTYTFTPNSGYHLGSLLLGNNEIVNQAVNNSYTLANIQANDTIIAKFAVDKNNTITANDIIYWVGEGTNEILFAVNWCNPEIALAWGYRFNGSSVLVSDVMNAIKEADTRFSYTDGSGFVTEITYNDDTYNLSLSGDYWMYNINEEPVMFGIDAQQVSNGDVIEFGDEVCGLTDDFWNYVWTSTITPVTNPVNIVSPENDKVQFALYPNPANDYTFLTVSGIEGNVLMQIVDMSGKVVMTDNFYANNQIIKNVEISHLSKGVYLVHLRDKNAVIMQKLIVY